MASAVEQLVNGNTSDQPVSFYDYYNAYGRDHSKNTNWFNTWQDADPNSFAGRWENFLHGTKSSALQEYNTYLAGFEYKKNAEASAKANQETWAREDSQVQRLMKDYEKAGLNPYVILNGGNLSSGVVSSQSQKPSYKRKALEEGKVDNKVMNSALKVLALLLLKKVL